MSPSWSRVRPAAWLVLAAGLVAMGFASVWAPPQPEFLQDGGACQISLCGMLEDPPRWRAAWWVWGAGLVAVVVSTALLSAPVRRVRAWLVLLVALLGPFLLLGILVLAAAVSWHTSYQGAATVLALTLVVPATALVAGVVRRR